MPTPPSTKKSASNGQAPPTTRHAKWRSEGRVQVHFITSEADHARLGRVAEEIERPQAWVLRQALREYLDRHDQRK